MDTALTEPIIPPLVTFAVFAYNQERYIEQAIASALYQTLQPLEIVISDDFSSDGTFSLIESIAASYSGPHLLRTNRNPYNLGTAAHVYRVSRMSQGRLIIVAAGDDISEPDRAERLFDAWDAAGRPSGVVHSGWVSFRDRDGAVVGQRRPVKGRPSRRRGVDSVLYGYANSRWLPAAAPTAAYTRDLFDSFMPLMGASIIEDAPLLLRAALRGQFTAVDAPLVRRRIHEGNTGSGYSVRDPKRWNRFVQSKLIAFRNMQVDLCNPSVVINVRLRSRIERRILSVSRSASWLFLPEGAPPSILDKAKLALRLLRSPAVSPRLAHRVIFTLRFFGVAKKP